MSYKRFLLARTMLHGFALGMLVNYWGFLILGLGNDRVFPIIAICCATGSLVIKRYFMKVTIDHQLIGVRGFQLQRDGYLSSLTQRGRWEPGVNIARCVRMDSPLIPQDALRAYTDHEVPKQGCHCGFNVYHSLKELQTSGYHFDVAAVVQGWGRARLHGAGWRSEKAKVVALIDIASRGTETHCHGPFVHYVTGQIQVENRIALDAASMRYNVPVITALQAASALEEFGTSVDQKLLPR